MNEGWGKHGVRESRTCFNKGVSVRFKDSKWALLVLSIMVIQTQLHKH